MMATTGKGKQLGNKLTLRMFITGRTKISAQALRALQRVLKDVDYDLQVVDLLENPEDAETERLIATPTLDKLGPPPRRRLIGDLSDEQQVRAILDLPSTT